MAELGYRDLVTFHSTDDLGHAVYHTNVMMAIGSDVAVVCSEAVSDAKERRHLLASLRRHHEVRTVNLPAVQRKWYLTGALPPNATDLCSTACHAPLFSALVCHPILVQNATLLSCPGG